MPMADFIAKYGMWIYLAVFSRFIIRFFVWIFRKIGKIFGKTGRILFGPLIKVARKIGLFLKKWLKKFQNHCRY